MEIRATNFRQNLFRYLDKIRDTGKPLIISLKGRKFKITAIQEKRNVDALPKRKGMQGSPESFIDQNWEDAWTGKDF